MIDSTSHLRIEEEIEVAYPRLAYEIRKTQKPGFVSLPVARLVEVHDKTLVFDEKFAPPVLLVAAHPTVEGWLDRVIGWIGAKLDELARYASDPTAGGGLQSADYLMLQMLNRESPVLAHFRRSRATCIPSGSTRSSCASPASSRPSPPRSGARATTTPYVHDDLESALRAAVARHPGFPQSAQLDRRAIRLELIERAANAYVSTIKDRTLFRNATFMLEVSARRPLAEIQQSLPAYPEGRPQHQDERDRPRPSAGRAAGASADAAAADSRHHRSRLFLPRPHLAACGRSSAVASAVGMHFAGDWPELQLEFWAIREGRR